MIISWLQDEGDPKAVLFDVPRIDITVDPALILPIVYTVSASEPAIAGFMAGVTDGLDGFIEFEYYNGSEGRRESTIFGLNPDLRDIPIDYFSFEIALENDNVVQFFRGHTVPDSGATALLLMTAGALAYAWRPDFRSRVRADAGR